MTILQVYCASTLIRLLKAPNLESKIEHVDVHAGRGDHGMLPCSEKLTVRAFHPTVLTHDPLTSTMHTSVRQVYSEQAPIRFWAWGGAPPHVLKIGDEWGGHVLNMGLFSSSLKRPRHPNHL